MKFSKEKFGFRLRIKQQALHLSVGVAAVEIGISKSTLSRLNREMFNPDVETYYLCCKWLGLPLEYFFNN